MPRTLCQRPTAWTAGTLCTFTRIPARCTPACWHASSPVCCRLRAILEVCGAETHPHTSKRVRAGFALTLFESMRGLPTARVHTQRTGVACMCYHMADTAGLNVCPLLCPPKGSKATNSTLTMARLGATKTCTSVHGAAQRCCCFARSRVEQHGAPTLQRRVAHAPSMLSVRCDC